jgi:hypothetical protein
MTAKFVGGMKPFGREEFDKLTGEFDVSGNHKIAIRVPR